MKPKVLPTLTEVLLPQAAAAPTPPSDLKSAAPNDPSLHDAVVAQIEQELVLSHRIEKTLSPALRDWVDNEVAREVAQQLETLAPQWAKALADAVTANLTARLPGVVDRLLQAATPPSEGSEEVRARE
jgi:hypothetical protein